MSGTDQTIGMDFFWDYDNRTFGNFGLEGPDADAAEDKIFPIAAQFYTSTPDDFQAEVEKVSGAMQFMKALNDELVKKHFGSYQSPDLMQAWVNFGTGVLFDERRNDPATAATFKYWAVHSMDSISTEQAKLYGARAISPSEYPYWYGAIRGVCMNDGGASNFYNDEMHSDYLQFGRALAVAAATQNIAKPWCVVGPSAYSTRSGKTPSVPFTNPNNPQVSAEVMSSAISKFKSLYVPMTLKELDAAFLQAFQRKGGPIQPPADY